MSYSALPQGAAAGNSMRASLLELAVVVVLAAGAGAAFAASRAGAPRGPDKPAESAGAPQAQPSTIVDLPPIVTNLGAPVGVVIALLQALTQIQEMTLTFVPKMIAVFVAASLTASFVGAKFSIFTQSIYGRIEQGYK